MALKPSNEIWTMENIRAMENARVVLIWSSA